MSIQEAIAKHNPRKLGGFDLTFGSNLSVCAGEEMWDYCKT